MKIIYGKGSCEIDGSIEPIESIVIKYRGNIVIRHGFAELYNIIENNLYFRNLKSKSLLVHGNNQIHIGFVNGRDNLKELFKYVGNFRIISAKVNDKNIPVEVFGVDYPNLINSKPENMGKPENYKGNYKFGRVPQKKTLKGIKNKTLKQLPSRSY